MKRVEKFRGEVKQDQLCKAARALVGLSGPGLRTLAALKLPEFSYLSFLSKIRMFIDPTTWVVLDRKLASLDVEPFRSIKQQPTYIPCSSRNEQLYVEWS